MSLHLRSKYLISLRYFVLSLFVVLVVSEANAQVNGSFTVGGDINKFYPVTFSDGGWDSKTASELDLGRSETHTNSDWRGSFIANFKYHVNRYGNGSDFIHADIKQVQNGASYSNVEFIGGWTDITRANYDDKIMIWLKGGGTTYYYRSKFIISISVYDGTANPYPYQEVNGVAHTFKTVADSYITSNGITHTGSAYFHGSNNNYFNGSMGIGVKDTKGYKLAVAGSVIAESIKVQVQGSWPDYVFEKSYKLPSLAFTEQQIKSKGHLPDMPSAKEVLADGINLAEMNRKLLQKIEELTLHLISQDKALSELKREMRLIKKK